MTHLGIDIACDTEDGLQLFEDLISSLESSNQRLDFDLTILLSNAQIESAQKYLHQSRLPNKLVHLVGFDSVIGMDDNAYTVMRHRQKSHLHYGLEMLNDGIFNGLITNVNTKALVAVAHSTLSSLKHVKRPILITKIPSTDRPFFLADTGATIRLSKEQMLTNSLLAISFFISEYNVKPKVALLNIGEEESKGQPFLKETADLIKSHPWVQKNAHFVGNCESHNIHAKGIDLILTDGFTGNIFLKTSEATSSYLLRQLKLVEASLNPNTPAFYQLQSYLNESIEPLGLLLGYNALIAKCHGHSSGEDIAESVHILKKYHAHGLIPKLLDNMGGIAAF